MTIPIRPALLILVAMFACMKESAYVAPSVVTIDPTTLNDSLLIPYRTLARGDFKADKPPRGLEGNHVAAATVAIIRATATTFSVDTVTENDSTYFVADADSFAFEARMSQIHSWWGKKHKGVTTEQMLEHEQIHFAIFEVGARRANAKIDEIRARIRSPGKTEVDAIRMATKRFRQEHGRVHEAIMARSAQFDMETANGQRKDRNHEWFARMGRELELTEAEMYPP